MFVCSLAFQLIKNHWSGIQCIILNRIANVTDQEVIVYIFCCQEHGIATDLKLEEKLHISIEPPYIILLSFVGRREGGVKFIVDMREDLLVSIES